MRNDPSIKQKVEAIALYEDSIVYGTIASYDKGKVGYDVSIRFYHNNGHKIYLSGLCIELK